MKIKDIQDDIKIFNKYSNFIKVIVTSEFSGNEVIYYIKEISEIHPSYGNLEIEHIGIVKTTLKDIKNLMSKYVNFKIPYCILEIKVKEKYL